MPSTTLFSAPRREETTALPHEVSAVMVMLQSAPGREFAGSRESRVISKRGGFQGNRDRP
jgi:hypothetical protein